MSDKAFNRWFSPAAAAACIAVTAAGAAYFGVSGSEGSPRAATAPYPFVFSQEDGLHVGGNVIPRPPGFLWADVSANSLVMLTHDSSAPGSFGTVIRSSLDGSNSVSLATGVIGVPLLNSVDGTMTVLTRVSLADPVPTLKKLVIETGNVVESIQAPINTLLSTLKPNGQAIITSGIDAFLWNTVQNLLQPLLEPKAVATQTILTSATSTLEFHADPAAGSSFLVAQPSGDRVRTFDGLLDGKLVGDKLVLWDVDNGSISRTSTSDPASVRTPAPLPDGFDFVMAWHGSNFLAAVHDVAPGAEADDAGPSTSTYFDCDAVAWECSQIGTPVSSAIADELGSTSSWQLRAVLELGLEPIGEPDGLLDTPESQIPD